MDATLRGKNRHNTLTSNDLRRAGYPILHCKGPNVIGALRKAGWYVLNEFHIVTYDCGTWTHCGPECCGPCPTCGDSRWNAPDDKRTLVAPFQPMSRTLAKRMLYRVMAQFH